MISVSTTSSYLKIAEHFKINKKDVYKNIHHLDMKLESRKAEYVDMYLCVNIDDMSFEIESPFIKTIIGQYLYIAPINRNVSSMVDYFSKNNIEELIMNAYEENFNRSINNQLEVDDYLTSKCTWDQLSKDLKDQAIEIISLNRYRITKYEIKKILDYKKEE